MEKKLGLKPGKITIKLLLGNLLLVFLPWIGILSLDTYESQLLVSLEKTLVQQGRFAAAGLGTDPRDLAVAAPAFLAKLEGRHEARIRVVDPQGRLLADSSGFGPRTSAGTGEQGLYPRMSSNLPAGREERGTGGVRADSLEEKETASSVEKADENWLYQLGTAPVRLYRWLFTSPRTGTIQDPYPDGAVLDGPEIRAALSGRYGARTRITPGEEASVTLYSAIPIYNGGEEPIGAVLVNQSTYRILVDLYELRLDVFRLSLLSLLAALVITIYLELSVARPLIRLTSQSRIWGGSRGPLQNFPPPLNRKDEIGQLSIALHQMAGELRERMKRMESFSSDVAHELKNPLASMAAASEIGLDLVKSPEGQKLFSRIETDVQRLRRLVDDIRDISRIDGLDKQEIEGHGTLASTLPQLLKEGWREVEDLSWILPKEDQTFPVRPGLMQRILVNLVDNADSLRPRGSTIIVEVFEDREFYGLRVSDQGPGFPAEILPRVFERFYSYRPEKGSRHSGLGLSLVQTIVQWTGGTCLAENYPIGSSQPMGARVSLTWPKVP